MRRHHRSSVCSCSGFSLTCPFSLLSQVNSSFWLLEAPLAAPHCCCSTFQRSSLPAPPNFLCGLRRIGSSLPASISWLIFLPLRGEEVCASFPKRPQMPRLLLLLLLSSPSFHCLLKLSWKFISSEQKQPLNYISHQLERCFAFFLVLV